MNKVTVIDYGAGNLLNVVRALEHCGAQPLVTTTADDIAAAERLILPGVGAFGDCMQALTDLELSDAIKAYIARNRLFLGICVGMQVMFETGEEFGEHAGLGILPGRVVRIPTFAPSGKPHKIPHMGWGSLVHSARHTTWKGTVLEPLEALEGVASTYFVHSYMGMPAPQHQLANVNYNGIQIAAAVKIGNAYGCQFHPEKSGETGLSILRTFLAMPV